MENSACTMCIPDTETGQPMVTFMADDPRTVLDMYFDYLRRMSMTAALEAKLDAEAEVER